MKTPTSASICKCASCLDYSATLMKHIPLARRKNYSRISGHWRGQYNPSPPFYNLKIAATSGGTLHAIKHCYFPFPGAVGSVNCEGIVNKCTIYRASGAVQLVHFNNNRSIFSNDKDANDIRTIDSAAPEQVRQEQTIC